MEEKALKLERTTKMNFTTGHYFSHIVHGLVSANTEKTLNHERKKIQFNLANFKYLGQQMVVVLQTLNLSCPVEGKRHARA